jgi:adenylate cyclase
MQSFACSQVFFSGLLTVECRLFRHHRIFPGMVSHYFLKKISYAIADDAKAAVRCALEMAAKLESLNQRWLSQGRPTVAMRVGIATGTVVAGSLGGVHRLEYTTIGDCVNLAARLESFDKSLDGGICRILINKRTYQYIHGLFATKLIGSAQIRGRQRLTRIYQVLLAPKLQPET